MGKLFKGFKSKRCHNNKGLIGNAKALVEIFSKHYINIDATTLRIAPKNSGNQIP